MNKAIRFYVSAAVTFLFVAAATAAYVHDNFEAQTVGVAPSGSGWSVSTGVAVSNDAAAIKNGARSLCVPVLSTVTNTSGSGSNIKVWTDFYTIPRPFLSDVGTVPAVDTNATAQFFVNSNGMWVTLSGNGSGGILTNTCLTALSPGIYPTVTQFTAFYHISVMHNYAVGNWSLFVNDVSVATNLNFIASGVTRQEWFQMQNFGGNTTNVCWLDDFLVTNKVPATENNVLTNVIPGTTIPLSVAWMAFGSFDDPRPTNEAVAASVAGVNLEFGRLVNDGRTFIVCGTPSYPLSGLASNGVVTPAVGNFLDSAALGSNSKYFYKLVTRSADGTVAVTNDETYAAFKQGRAQNRTYIVGAPMDTRDGDRSIAGSLGQQLASGLAAGDTMTIYVAGIPDTYTLQGGGTWSGANTAQTIAPGQGVMIRRLSGGTPTSAAYLSGTVPTNVAPSINIVAGFNIVAWPYGGTGTLGEFSGLSDEQGTAVKDYIYLQNVSQEITLARWTATGWRTGLRVGSGSVINPVLQPGAGILIWHSGAAGTWTP